MALVAIIMGMLILSAIGITMTNFVSSNSSIVSDNLQSSQAFYVAEGGMQYVLMNQLNGDNNYADNVSPTAAPFGAPSINLSPGQFWIEYLNQAQTSVTVRVTARVGNATRAIQQSVVQGGSGFKDVTMAKGNLSINNSTGIVSGDVVLGGNYSIAPAVQVLGNITVDHNIQIPAIDYAPYLAMVTTTFNGNKTFSSNYSGNARVTGNATINAGITITGLLYVDGNVAFNGNNIVINGSLITKGNLGLDGRSGLQFISQTIDSSHHMPAILTKGNIGATNADNMELYGVVWTGGNLSLANADNLDYLGSFMTGGNVSYDNMKNIKMTFDPVYVTGVPGLPNLGASQTPSVVLSGWQSY